MQKSWDSRSLAGSRLGASMAEERGPKRTGGERVRKTVGRHHRKNFASPWSSLGAEHGALDKFYEAHSVRVWGINFGGQARQKQSTQLGSLQERMVLNQARTHRRLTRWNVCLVLDRHSPGLTRAVCPSPWWK